MSNDQTRISQLELEVQELKSERDELLRQLELYAKLAQRDVSVVGEEAGLMFERDCFQSAVITLSNWRYRKLDQDLLDFIKQNSPTLETVIDDLMKKAS